ncbi:MAG: hypothetical protein LBS50_01440 [Prevotellaceae bacterium]|jgi:hypothetical protein|nr:hypothetical protein [Prevotellaceae bacterium]
MIDFTKQGRMPFTQEILARMQSDCNGLAAALAKFVGNNAIIDGVTPDGNGGWSDGWIIYNDELLPFVAGSGNFIKLVESALPLGSPYYNGSTPNVIISRHLESTSNGGESGVLGLISSWGNSRWNAGTTHYALVQLLAEYNNYTSFNQPLAQDFTYSGSGYTSSCTAVRSGNNISVRGQINVTSVAASGGVGLANLTTFLGGLTLTSTVPVYAWAAVTTSSQPSDSHDQPAMFWVKFDPTTNILNSHVQYGVNISTGVYYFSVSFVY